MVPGSPKHEAVTYFDTRWIAGVVVAGEGMISDCGR